MMVLYMDGGAAQKDGAARNYFDGHLWGELEKRESFLILGLLQFRGAAQLK